MADPSSFGASQPADWRRRVVGASLILLGGAGVATAGWLYFDAWSTREAWDSSVEAATLAEQVAAPTPVWLPEATPAPVVVQVQPIPPRPGLAPGPVPPLFAPQPAVSVAPTAVVRAEDLSLDSVDFRFLDPPEPGAHARVAIDVTNHAPTTSPPILLGISSKWFEGYAIIGSAPAVADDRTNDNGLRTFSFPPILSGATANYELHVSAVGEGTTAPAVTVLLPGGEVIGQENKPTTLAPTPRPGPVMAIEIPRLKLKSGVVQTVWEPPPFAVGQIKGTANITTGNTVLIGHLTGAAGNVFAHLDQLKPGDKVTATSRGLAYSFVVSQTFASDNKNASPIEPADDSRLTLMTCAGVWNPFTRDYSERLWVIAEPPEQAAVTIANAEATATAQATERAVATATALAVEPTSTSTSTPTPQPTPTPVPTAYAAEPSLPGGIGNTRRDLEKAFGAASGETSGKLVVFRKPNREVHVAFTPDPPRAALVSLRLSTAIPFDAAVQESRKLFPLDTLPRAAAPEGNPHFVVERFSSTSLGLAVGSPEFSVIYTRDGRGAINAIILGPGDDFDELIEQARS